MDQQDDLNFKISIAPRKLNEHISPDAELTTESSDPSDVHSIYQQYGGTEGATFPEIEHAQELKSLNIFDSSSSEYDLRQAGHPFVCIFTFLFKLAAILSYMSLNLILKDDALVYIVVVTIVCIDFWVTKNISGRMLVGLRWNNEFLLDGTEVWKFESHHLAEQSNRVDKAFFWTSLIISFVFWMLMVIGDFLTLRIFWITLSGLAFVLVGSNFVGFYKCRGEHQRRMNMFQQELTRKGLNVVGMVMLNSKYRS